MWQHTFDAKIRADKVNVAGNTYPATEQDTAGNRPIICESLESLTVNQASTDIVTPGSKNNTILRLDFNVTGYSSTLMLNSIEVESNNTNNNDVAASGVKLYRTDTTTFSTDNQLGEAESFTSAANFSSLNYDLPQGKTYVWVTYDVASDATAGKTRWMRKLLLTK